MLQISLVIKKYLMLNDYENLRNYFPKQLIHMQEQTQYITW